MHVHIKVCLQNECMLHVCMGYLSRMIWFFFLGIAKALCGLIFVTLIELNAF